MSSRVLPDVVYDELEEMDTEDETDQNGTAVTSNPPVLRPQTLVFEENSFLVQQNNEIAKLIEIIKDQRATLKKLMAQVSKLTEKVTELTSVEIKEKEQETGPTKMSEAKQPKSGNIKETPGTETHADEPTDGDEKTHLD